MVIKKHLKFLLPLLLLGLFALKTFWGPDFFDGHDAQNHIVRLYQYDLAIKDGQLPPRWAGGLMAGYGYPVFIFAYPLPYFLAETFHLIGFNLAVSIKLTMALSYILSSLAMYYFSSQYWQSKKAGFVSALLWSFAPYIFVKLFITASLGVVVSYAFIPLFFLFLYKLLINPNLKNSIFLSLTASAWLLSHSFTPIIFSPLIFFFTLFNFQKKLLKKTIIFISLSLLFCFFFTAWHLLPALLELKYTYFSQFVTHEYQNHFVSLKRLLYSKWGTGAPGWSDNPLSQQVGIAQWLSIAIGIVIFRKKKSKKLTPFIISFFLSIFLMLSPSRFVWDSIPLLASVHIPWRFLSLAVFSSAAVSGFLIKTIKSKKINLVIYGLLIGLTLYGNRNHLRINEIRVYNQAFFQNYIGVATGWNEHLPIWIKKIPKSFPDKKVEVISGNCAITNLINQSNLTIFNANCQDEAKIQLNTAYYPRWQVLDNNQIITNQVKKNLETSNGLIQFSLNSGQHQVKAIFGKTAVFSQLPLSHR